MKTKKLINEDYFDRSVCLKIENTSSYRSKKNGNIYTVMDFFITNATNAQDGDLMVLYFDKHMNPYVRNKEEFYEKFTEVGGE